MRNMLRPPRKKVQSYKDHKLDRMPHKRLTHMKFFCLNYINMQTGHSDPSWWRAASLKAEKSQQKGKTYAAQLCQRVWNFIEDKDAIPEHNHGKSEGRSLINNNDFAQELSMHLTSPEVYICA